MRYRIAYAVGFGLGLTELPGLGFMFRLWTSKPRAILDAAGHSDGYDRSADAICAARRAIRQAAV